MKGKKVGVTAVSHKVIRNLLDMAVKRAREKGIEIVIRHKPKSGEKPEKGDTVSLKNKDEAYIALRLVVHGDIPALYRPELFIMRDGNQMEDDKVEEIGDLTVYLDPESAQKADGVGSVDYPVVGREHHRHHQARNDVVATRVVGAHRRMHACSAHA